MSNTPFILISQTNPMISATLSYQDDGTVLYTYINESTSSYQTSIVSFYQLMPWMPIGNLVSLTAPAKGSSIGTFKLGFTTMSYDTSRFSNGDFATQLNQFLNGVQSAAVVVYKSDEQQGSLMLTCKGLQYLLASGNNGSYGAAMLQWTISLADLKTAAISVNEQTFSIQDQENYLYSAELFPFAPVVSGGDASTSSNQSVAEQNMTALLQTFVSAAADEFVSNNILSLTNTSDNAVTLGVVEEQTAGALPYENPIQTLGKVVSGQTCVLISSLANDFVLMQPDGYPLAYVDAGVGIASSFSVDDQTSNSMNVAASVLQTISTCPSSPLAQVFTQFSNCGGAWLMYQFEQALQTAKDNTHLVDILTLLGYQSSQLQAWTGSYYLYGSKSKDYLAELVVHDNNTVSYNGESLSNVTFTKATGKQAAVLQCSNNSLSISLNFFWYPPSSAIDTKTITKACSGTITQDKQTITINGYGEKVTASVDTFDLILQLGLNIGGLLAFLYQIYKFIKGQSPTQPDPKALEELEQKAAAVREQIYEQALDSEANDVAQGLNPEAGQLERENSEGYDVTAQEQEVFKDINALENDVPLEKPVDAKAFEQDVEGVQSLGDDATDAVSAAQQGLEAEYGSQSAVYQQAKVLESQAKAESKQIEQSVKDAEDDMDGDGEGIDDDFAA